MYSKVSDISSVGGKIIGLIAFKKNLHDRKKAIQKELENLFKNDIDNEKVNMIFTNIEKVLQNKKIKNY